MNTNTNINTIKTSFSGTLIMPTNLKKQQNTGPNSTTCQSIQQISQKRRLTKYFIPSQFPKITRQVKITK